MNKWVRNDKGAIDIWASTEMQIAAYYQIQEYEENRWSEASKVLTDIHKGDLTVTKDDTGTKDITNTSLAVNFLHGNIGSNVEVINYHVRVTVEETPEHYYRTVQTDKVDDTVVDPAYPSTPVHGFVIEYADFNVPTCAGNSPSDLTIRTNVGSAIVDDDYVVAPHSSDKKYIKMVLVRDDGTTDLEIKAFEKTTDEYASMPAGHTHIRDLKEFSVVANGTVLVEVEDFI